jgi:hypothetical protein
VSQLSQLSQGAGRWNFREPVATVATVAAPEATQNGLADLLARHGGFPGIDWAGLALIDAAQSDLWIVQRPDGQLTLIATVEPIPKPRSYTAAWPARFTSPEPVEDTAPAVEAAQAAIERACQICWDCKHLDTTPKPSCSAGHLVVWQRAQTRTYPRRADRAGPCPRFDSGGSMKPDSTTLTRAIAERASLDAAIPRSEADDVAETRRILDDLRHAAALSRAWDGMHSRDSPQEATGSPQSGLQTASGGQWGIGVPARETRGQCCSLRTAQVTPGP